MGSLSAMDTLQCSKGQYRLQLLCLFWGKNTDSESPVVKKGFKNWKKASGVKDNSLDKDMQSSEHQMAEEKALNWLRNCKPGNDIACKIVNQVAEQQITYNFRKSFNVEVDRPRTEVGRSSFKHRASLSWNLLPDDIKTCSNLDSFKKKLKANKNLLKSVSFTKASFCISNKSLDFKYF